MCDYDTRQYSPTSANNFFHLQPILSLLTSLSLDTIFANAPDDASQSKCGPVPCGLVISQHFLSSNIGYIIYIEKKKTFFPCLVGLGRQYMIP